jgi:hypothetical protein
LAAGTISIATGLAKRKQYTETRTNLETVNTALVQFATRQGRLPCEADGTALTGLEARSGTGTCTATTTGIVPWLSLGLTENDVTDGWFNRISYRVAPELARDSAMNLTNCDTVAVGGATAAGKAPNQTCEPCVVVTCSPAPCINAPCPRTAVNAVLVGKGLTVQNLAGAVQASPAAMTGAAYVLISHGENTIGAFGRSGILQVGAPPAGTGEIKNANNLPLQSFYVADELDARDAPNHFDDQVLYKTVHWVVGQARLDARAH